MVIENATLDMMVTVVIYITVSAPRFVMVAQGPLVMIVIIV